MKFSESTSNQSSAGLPDRISPKWTVRSPMPIPRSGRPKRFIGSRVRRDRGGGLRGPVNRPDVRPNAPYFEGAFVLGGATGTAQPPLPLQEFLPAQPASPV